MLRYCSECKEKSVIVKVYQERKRVEYCTNKGCGYQQELPEIEVKDDSR
jgi:peroxiredoxin